MPHTITYLDGNWNVVDEDTAAFRMVATTDENGRVLLKRRESLGPRKGQATCSTDPRAGAIMREAGRARPMSNPTGR